MQAAFRQSLRTLIGKNAAFESHNKNRYKLNYGVVFLSVLASHCSTLMDEVIPVEVTSVKPNNRYVPLQRRSGKNNYIFVEESLHKPGCNVFRVHPLPFSERKPTLFHTHK